MLEAVLRAAQSGDIVAAAIILKRCWPESCGRPVRLERPTIAIATDVVEGKRKTIETIDVLARIEALERLK